MEQRRLSRNGATVAAYEVEEEGIRKRVGIKGRVGVGFRVDGYLTII